QVPVRSGLLRRNKSCPNRDIREWLPDRHHDRLAITLLEPRVFAQAAGFPILPTIIGKTKLGCKCILLQREEARRNRVAICTAVGEAAVFGMSSLHGVAAGLAGGE